jgi:hypothetical protein
MSGWATVGLVHCNKIGGRIERSIRARIPNDAAVTIRDLEPHCATRCRLTAKPLQSILVKAGRWMLGAMKWALRK